MSDLTAYRPLVLSAARELRRAWPDVPFEDLEAAGWLGLLEALPRFDPARNVKPETFAAHRIRGAIIDGARRSVAGHRYGNTYRRVTVDALPEDWDMPAVDDVAEQATDRVVAEQAARVILGLPPKARAAALLWFWTPLSMRQVGDRLQVTESRVSQIITNVKSRLRESLGVSV